MAYRQHPLTKAQRKAMKQGRKNTIAAYTRAQMRYEVMMNMPANVAGSDTATIDWPPAMRASTTTITNP